MTDSRRLIPRTDAVLADPRFAADIAELGYPAVKAVVVATLQRVRDGSAPVEDIHAQLLRTLADQRAAPVGGLRPVINATGVIVHTNLGRAPLSLPARQALAAAAGYTDVEFDLVTGERARRGRTALAPLAAAVPAAQAVHVVNNTAAALLLTALVLAPGRDIVISRGELVEIGDGFRIPELLSSAGARLREVGTTNRTHLADYRAALGPDTGFVLKVHPSNFTIDGFVAGVGLAELAGLGVPVVADLGSGLLEPHPLLPDEPDAATALASGADLVLASGDKLLGGPQAGLMLGRADLIERLRRHPAARALRVDKLTLAALEATLRHAPTPVAQALQLPLDQLADRAGGLARQLRELGVEVGVIDSVAAVGGGGAPGVELASVALSLPVFYAARLRVGDPAVVGRIERERCLLDLRTVPGEQDQQLLQAVLAVER